MSDRYFYFFGNRILRQGGADFRSVREPRAEHECDPENDPLGRTPDFFSFHISSLPRLHDLGGGKSRKYTKRLAELRIPAADVPKWVRDSVARPEMEASRDLWRYPLQVA